MKFKSFYLAGATATVLGVAPATLRQWRDRDICHLGSIEEGAEDNPRSRRRYSLVDICKMSIALAMVKNGFSHEEAFNRVTNVPSIHTAVAATVLETGGDDVILTTLITSFGELTVWANSVTLPLQEWKANIAGAFHAVDPIDTADVECVSAINVSAIARNALKRLATLVDGEE
ncbi:hypothetical protein [Agrobacterium sp.]|uniref:hypothetical protein n=1 Tax=Agrobacterium sp. TaxID=361 RepID=UPI0028A9C4C0